MRDESYRIGDEAIRNACTHSRGSRLDIDISDGRDFTVRVVDDGVGAELTTAGHGEEGHFGQRGIVWYRYQGYERRRIAPLSGTQSPCHRGRCGRPSTRPCMAERAASVAAPSIST